jgi:flavodoxin
MKSVVIYASRSGNTRVVAEAIANELGTRGSVELHPIDQAPHTFTADTDLVVVGGPTEGHGMTEPIIAYLDGLTATAFDGIAAAAFDTRLWWPRALSGSAASGIAKRLQESGARLAVREESFIVSMKPALEPGELERAAAWAATLADAVEARTPVTV